MKAGSPDLATLRHRIRHVRGERGFTLDQLGEAIGLAGSQLSLIENGKREPKLSTLDALAAALDVELAELLAREAPSRRAALELELGRAQSSPLYATLGLPAIRPARGITDDTLAAIVGLHRELQRRASEAIATPEEARRANTDLRERMRAQANYLPDIEQLAEEQVHAAGHRTGAVTHREVGVMAERLGFQLIYVIDRVESGRSFT